MSTTHEAVARGPAERDSGEPSRLLEAATRSADQLLAEARAEAERIRAAARAEAEQIVAGARADLASILTAIEESRARIRADTALLRQAEWARRDRLPRQEAPWLPEGPASEVG